MRAIILAGGQGTRLERMTGYAPKSLLPISDHQTLLGHQIELLGARDIKGVTLVTGYLEDKIRAYVKQYRDGFDITCFYQGTFDKANYISDLFLTGNPSKVDGDDILLMHGDVVMEPTVLDALLYQKAGNAVLVNNSIPPPPKDFKARIQNQRVVGIGVEFNEEGDYFCLPVYKFKSEAYDIWLKAMGELIAKGGQNAYAETALNQVLEQIELHPTYFDGFGMEVDTIDDLFTARHRFQFVNLKTKEVRTQ